MTPSTRSAFDRELAGIRDDILRMGSLVDAAIDRASRAFQAHDMPLAHEIIDSDRDINVLRYTIEREVNAAMALQAPMAHDLRLLLASFSIAAELERMGDYAEGIARTVLRYPEEGIGDIPSQMGDMTIHVRQMLAQSLEAYAREDVAAAEAAAQTDDLVDRLYRQMFKWIVEQMSEGKILAERGTYLLWAGHNLERMGDRITNICERVLFSKTGAIEREMNPKGQQHKEPPR